MWDLCSVLYWVSLIAERYGFVSVSLSILICLNMAFTAEDKNKDKKS